MTPAEVGLWQRRFSMPRMFNLPLTVARSAGGEFAKSFPILLPGLLTVAEWPIKFVAFCC